MQKSTEVKATVISPSRNMNFRKGKGFSLSEIKQAGKSVQKPGEFYIVLLKEI